MQAAVRVFCFFSVGYFVSYSFRGLNIGFASYLIADMGLSAADLGMLTSLYFLGFALTQIPAGAALDTWGPRRVNACVMLLAALGSLIFGLSDDLPGLMAGRFLIGAGVAVCLGAAMQALAQNFPMRRLPMLNGAVVGIGCLGGVVVGSPLSMVLRHTSWQTVSFGLAAFTAGVSALIWFGVRDVPTAHGRARPSMAAQFLGTWGILRTPLFWKLALFPAVAGAAFFAVQSLWMKPFLLDVSHLSEARSDWLVSLMGAATVAGSVGLGVFARRFGRWGIDLHRFSGLCLLSFALVQVAMLLQIPVSRDLLWTIYGLFGSANILLYAVLIERFPAEVWGRVTTAFTMLLFLLVFVFQNAMGWIVELWTPLRAGVYPPEAHLAAWWVALALQALSMVWYFWPERPVARELAPR